MANHDVTSMEALDSTSSDTFEVSNDLTAAASDMPESAEPDVTIPSAMDGNDWFGEEGDEDVSTNVPDVEQLTDSEESSENVEESEAEGSETSDNTVSIDVRRKQHDFNLDPKDETLRRTLRNGVRAEGIKAENDTLKASAADMASRLEEANEATEVFNELQSLASEGDFDRVVQAVLGDAYQDYVESKIDDFITYQNSDPSERARLDAEKAGKNASYAERAKDKKIKELESKLEDRSASAESDKLHGYATSSLKTHMLAESEVADGDIRNRLNKRMWSSAWDNIKALGKTREITPKLIDAVFAQEAKLSRFGINKNSDSATAASVQKKKEQAAATAATIATSNHPKPSGNGFSWDGKDAKDILKSFMK